MTMAKKKDIIELRNNDTKYERIVYLNGDRIGWVRLEEGSKKVYDPETAEEKAAREEHNRTHRFGYKPEPHHYEKYTYFSGRITDKYGGSDLIPGEYRTPYEARNAVAEAYTAGCKEVRGKKSNVAYLPSGDNSDFYPTPSEVAGKMFQAVSNWHSIKTVLEPSAGKGDLLDSLSAFCEKCHMYYGKTRRFGRHRTSLDIDVDCIEADWNLRYILRGKGYRVIHDDFLSFNSRKKYDLIVMNPPFSDGDKHLLKALEMQQDGGQIVCLLNAETLRNICTNSRHTLAQRLREYNANIQYIKGAFSRAERRTDVEIALVSVSIPESAQMKSEFFERMKKAKTVDFGHEREARALAPANTIERMVREYEIERDAALAFITEYRNLRKCITQDDEQGGAIIGITINGRDAAKCGNEEINRYLKAVRKKHWKAFLRQEEITGKLTSKLREEFWNSIEKMADYDFSMFNIEQMVVAINVQIFTGIEGQIMSLFDTLSAKHSWYPECDKNIHYYTGWKTNKAHKVGMKVILPINGFNASYSWKHEELDEYSSARIMNDLEKTLDYLDGKRTNPWMSVESVIRNANAGGITKNIEFKYWTASFYKKGTIHLKFKDQRIIDALNIFAAQKRSWLPPFYGKIRYEDMEPEAQKVIDEFQGKEAYEAVMQNPSVYLAEASENIGLLAAAT